MPPLRKLSEEQKQKKRDRERIRYQNRSPQDSEIRKARGRAYCRKLKHAVFAHYGNTCACCGDTTFEFLSVDHVGGWGKDHKMLNGKRYAGGALYAWICKNKFPQNFRLLCGSCHYALSFHRYCPHERERQANAAMLQSTQASNPDVVM